jgi:penicillin-binding protein 1B
MAEKTTKKRSSRYGTKTRAGKLAKRGSHWLRNLSLVALLGGGAGLTVYMGYLDHSVRTQFDGKRWAIPARVYASPLELYAGQRLSASGFESLLKRLHYRADDLLSTEGTYVKNGAQISVRTRDFNFWDQAQSSVKMALSFTGDSIEKITDLKKAQEMALVRLEPVQIGSFYPTIKEDRVLIKLEDAPAPLIKALLASEDRDFYHHHGVSVRGIIRAIWADVRAGGLVQGGSTITQQLAKNFYLTSERRLWRKVREVLMALILEYRYSKDEILAAYLNEIYLGQDGSNGVHGFGLASEFYYGSPLKELDLDQLVTLVALVRGPSEYDPRRFPERALQRRDLVLDAMVQQNYLTVKQAKAAKAQPLSVIPRTHRASNRYPAFLDFVKRQLKEDYKEQDITSEGLRIFTTLDTQVQDTLEATVAKKLAQLEKMPNANHLEAAVVVTRRDNAEIAAIVGGKDDSGQGFNRALDAVRPIGSLIKPAIYLSALEKPDKYTITTRVSDAEIHVKNESGKDWQPQNYDHREHGRVPLHTALAKSYNLATVRVGMDVGIAKIAKTLKSMGVSRELELYPSLLLGASSLTPLEVTQMYQTLAGDGFFTPIKGIRAVVSAQGEQLQSYPFVVKQVVDPAATYIVNTMMQGVMREGTGKAAYEVFAKDYGLAGKTGTTNDAKDSWFAGFTGDYLSVVWLGRDDDKPIALSGSTGALPVWVSLMKQISAQPVLLTPPDNIAMTFIDPRNGLLANKGCAGAREYPYIAGSAPTAFSGCGAAPAVKEDDKQWFEDLFTE